MVHVVSGGVCLSPDVILDLFDDSGSDGEHAIFDMDPIAQVARLVGTVEYVLLPMWSRCLRLCASCGLNGPVCTQSKLGS
jgi:hypothetical protein